MMIIINNMSSSMSLMLYFFAGSDRAPLKEAHSNVSSGNKEGSMAPPTASKAAQE